VLLDAKKDMEKAGLDSLCDQLVAHTETSMSDVLLEKGAAAIATLLLKGIASTLAPELAPVLKVIVDKAITAAAGVAGKAAVASASGARREGMLTAGDLREAQTTALIAGSKAARIKLIDEKDSYYYSPTGVADATALVDALAAADDEELKRETYLTALSNWTEALSDHDAPWSDKGKLRIKVRFGSPDDAVEIVKGTVDGLPEKVLAKLRGGPNTIQSLVEHGIHVEVYQTGDTHFELSSDKPLATDYHTGAAAYLLVERANQRHGTELDVTLPGAATAAAWHVWNSEILPLSLDKVLTE